MQCSDNSSGDVHYTDEYGITYRTSWSTSQFGVDVTTVIEDPRHTLKQSGRIVGRSEYRDGIVTTIRQLISADNQVKADGTLVEEAEILISRKCNDKQSKFCYTMSYGDLDDVDTFQTIGPRWSDVDSQTDQVLWGSIDPVGTVSPGDVVWIDVWS